MFGVVRHELEAGRLILPTLPEVAIRIRDIVGRTDVDAAVAATEIAKDPIIAGRIISVANSAGVRGLGPEVGSLRQAVTRLGFDLTRVLVNQMVLQTMFSAGTPVLRKIMLDTWTRSQEVAALAQVLATSAGLVAETALLAGLIHRVGMLPIVRLLDRHPALVTDEATTRYVVGRLHPPMANLLLKAWRFPPELQSVPRFAFDYARQHDGPPDYADVVSVANLLTASPSELERRFEPDAPDRRKAPGRVDRRQRPGSKFDRRSVPAFAKLGVSPEVETVETSGLLDPYNRNLTILRS